MNENDPAAIIPVPDRLRPLKCDELVKRGDFVRNGDQVFNPWEGPTGFRADAFVKRIYRRRGRPPGEAKKA